MITVHFFDEPPARPHPKTPIILGVFSFRYDSHLVPSLIANIRPMVDGWVSYDDRLATEAFSNEVARRRSLVSAARDAGASWALAIDPDERIEGRFARRIRALTRTTDPTAYLFDLREMYTTDSYRVDGLWGRKRIARLVSLHDDMTFDAKALHSSWHEYHPRYRVRHTGANIYHLKMIAPERRQARRDLYKLLDPERQYQSIGYDYLADETSLTLKRITRRRAFHPPHHEDFGLWMPATASTGQSSS